MLSYRGPAPAGSRGTLRRDGVGERERERQRQRERERERMNVAVKKVERKRLIFLGLHRKPIKHLHGTCSVHEGLRRPLALRRRRREPSREGLRSPGRKVNSESLCAPGDQPEKERERERERPKE